MPISLACSPFSAFAKDEKKIRCFHAGLYYSVSHNSSSLGKMAVRILTCGRDSVSVDSEAESVLCKRDNGRGTVCNLEAKDAFLF